MPSKAEPASGPAAVLAAAGPSKINAMLDTTADERCFRHSGSYAEGVEQQHTMIRPPTTARPASVAAWVSCDTPVGALLRAESAESAHAFVHLLAGFPLTVGSR
jgi:hypothetical protein